MPNEILSYIDVCRREGASLQRGMNFALTQHHSVILMSLQPGAPYRDRLEDDGTVLVYEGHDEPRNSRHVDPKRIDQPERNPRGKPTQNGLFFHAAEEYKLGTRPPEPVRVYEKLKQGIWSYNGVFHLVDAWREHDGKRNVFRFKLVAVDGEEESHSPIQSAILNVERRRIIPTAVKVEVWTRDGGKCVVCGASDELHFDHDLPYSKGGTSVLAANVQLLCARHNLRKHNRIL
jgi:hypothetical protein